ncbi:MAG: rhomboid family intramembrane serine protease [Terriglobales bacterium]
MPVCSQCGAESVETLCPECQSKAAPPPSPRHDFGVTAVLVAINVLVFALMVLKGASFTQPTSDQILRWGANFGPLTLDRQWWRLLTAMFVHIGIVHLAVNMWCLWQLGGMAEHLYGRRSFLWLYLLTGLAASLASLIRNPVVVTAGASGAIFGVAGALIATLYLAKLPAPRNELRISLVSLVVFAAFNLVYGIRQGGVDNGAHVGGFIAGLLLGTALSFDFPRLVPRTWRVRPYVFPVFAAILLIAAVTLRRVDMPIVKLEKAEQLFRKGDTSGGIRELDSVLKARPNLYAGWMLLGLVQLRNHQDAPAEAAFQRAAQIRPNDVGSRTQLAFLYLRSNRMQPAQQVLQRITEIDPRNVEARINLGVILNRLGRPKEAFDTFQNAVRLNPNVPLAWYNLGLTAMNLKRYDDAIAAFQRAAKLQPRDPDAWVWLANAYQAKGMTKEADEAYLTGYKLRASRVPAAKRQ